MNPSPLSPLALAVAELCAGRATVRETVDRLAALRPFKVCPCCGQAYDSRQWMDLPLCGYQRAEGEPTLELRNCGCGSTLAIEKAEAAPLALAELSHEKYDPEEEP